MPIHLDKKTKRLFIQFTFRGQTVKRRLPVGVSREDAARLETKLKHDLFFENSGISSRTVPTFERFVEDVYLEFVADNQAHSLKRAIAVCAFASAFLKDRPIDHIKPSDIERIKSAMLSKPGKHG
ncbi:MAG: hypothetical protein AB7J13_13520, partial [Pyrinomonadaceae bacterium]